MFIYIQYRYTMDTAEAYQNYHQVSQSGRNFCRHMFLSLVFLLFLA